MLNGMKLQNCNPLFDARDTIIHADEVLTGGENYRVLWFCREGLGVYVSVVDGDGDGEVEEEDRCTCFFLVYLLCWGTDGCWI